MCATHMASKNVLRWKKIHVHSLAVKFQGLILVGRGGSIEGRYGEAAEGTIGDQRQRAQIFIKILTIAN